jgi:hypothetical protein
MVYFGVCILKKIIMVMENLRKISRSIILLAMVLLSFASCNSSDDAEEIVVANLAKVTIDGTSYQSINERVVGNENCNSVYVGALYYDENNIRFYLRFEFLKNGELKRVWYEESLLPSSILDSGQIFLTPNFNAVSTFAIENFVYREFDNYISFDFEGKVFLENDENKVREISGTIESKSLIQVYCATTEYSMVLNDASFKFNSLYYSGTKFPDTSEQIHRYISNNGWIAEMKIEEDFWNLGSDEFTFDENSDNRVEMSHYIGPILANQIPLVNPDQWQIYQTRGSFKIEGRTVIDNLYKEVYGTISMEVLLNDVVVYKVQGMKFTAPSLED